MSALAFLVRGRSVDLVAMTARHALQETMGLADEVIELMRDQMVLIDDVDAADASRWTQAFTAHQHWFNPNKHRYAAVIAAPGASASVRDGSDWPSAWLQSVAASDRPDLANSADLGDVLDAWIAAPSGAGTWSVTLAVWDHENGLGSLPTGHWPDRTKTCLRGALWTLVLKAQDADTAMRRATEIAITQTRGQGLLVHPHMEGWAVVAPPRSLDLAEVRA